VERKIERLRSLRKELKRMVGGPHGSLRDCRIIETLADHSLCGSAH
jgi:hypothetical protein